ncbi:MAG TPA: DUF4439 domain-containing protein [Mycobacteriales bacterium]|nr:DUF4439 domain-containing protein [Mycobacteriales bacterium]
MSLVEALQRALAIEYQVIYGYGVLGAHLTAGKETNAAATPAMALQRLQEHQDLRDRLAELVHAAGRTPVTAEPAYRLPYPVTDPSGARRLAQHLENTVASAAYAVIAASRPDSPARALMIGALIDAADWQTRWAVADFAPFAFPFPGRPGQPAAIQPSTTPTSSPS